jgi:hypothetical protein
MTTLMPRLARRLVSAVNSRAALHWPVGAGAQVSATDIPGTSGATSSPRHLIAGRRFLAAAFAATAVLGAFPADVEEYRHYAQEFLAHLGRAWPIEYPPAAIVPMLPAALSPFAFGFAMAFIGVAVYGTLRRVSPHVASSWLVLSVLGTLFTMGGRYDIVPAACCLWAVLAAERRQWAGAWAWSGVAAALQWFGALLWPLWLIAEWRATRRWRLDRAVLTAAGVVATYGVAWMGEGGHAWTSVLWFLRRPVEVESMAATVGALVGPVSQHYSFGSTGVFGPQMAGVHTAIMGAQFLGQIAIWALYGAGRLNLRGACTLALTWLVAVGTVFSPQYLIWVLPLWALTMSGLRPAWLPMLVGALTTLEFPFVYTHAPQDVLAVASIRNVTLLALALVMLVRALRDPVLSGQQPIHSPDGG